MDKRERKAAVTQFVTLVASAEEERRAKLGIASLRAFGGTLKDSPVRAFVPRASEGRVQLDGLEGVQTVLLDVEERSRAYPFADKVSACARAEETAGPDVSTLVWFNPGCLILNAPLLFALSSEADAAFRPVHIRNIGSPAGSPLDDYWRGIYQATGAPDSPWGVESFVDEQKLRPYYNTHCFSIAPSKGLLRAWQDSFEEIVTDQAFQSGPCQDAPHRIFLHQAILSALIAKTPGAGRIRLLPPEYSYPLHLHARIPKPKQVRRLNELAVPVYEETEDLTILEVEEPLRSWLAPRLEGLGAVI